MHFGKVALTIAVLLAAATSCDTTTTKKRYPIPTDATLVLVREKKVGSVVGVGAIGGSGDDDNESLEASGVAVQNGTLHVVFDNSTSVATIAIDLSSGTLSDGDLMNSQYEAITFGGAHEHAFVSIEGSPATFVELDDTGSPLTTFPAPDLIFPDPNKGIEGLAWIGEPDGDRLLALSEKDGLITVLTRGDDEWTPMATLAHPAATNAFADYSDIALRKRDDNSGSYDVAITSQQSSAVWIGTLTPAPYQLIGPGKVYGFPVASDGTVRYCTVEGVTFIDDKTLALVSDKAHDNEPSCKDEDESVHIFTLP